MNTLRPWITTLALLPLFAACGVVSNDDPAAEGGMAAAWQSFRNGQYAAALDAFRELGLDGSLYPEATQGEAWCYLMSHEADLAVPAFRQALLADPEQTAALAGEAFALRDATLPDYDRLLSKARQSLQRSPDFVFSHRSSINWMDLHVLMAQAFFYQQRFDSTLAHLQAVDPSLALDPADTLSWQQHSSYSAALFEDLIRLTDLTAD